MEEHKVLEINHLIQEEKGVKQVDSPKREVWRSCCLETDPHAIAYISQISISILILGFSFVMLVSSNGSCEKSSPYIGLISFILGRVLSTVKSSTD